MLSSVFVLSLCAASALARPPSRASSPARVVLSNDDGFAVAIVRAQYVALQDANYDVLLSCPAQNESGTGSKTTNGHPWSKACEFDACPADAPTVGTWDSDPYINYVNGYPVDAVKYGIEKAQEKAIWGDKPDFVVSGPNVGNNLGPTVNVSGTVGAACEAVREGIPAIAFSADGNSTAQRSFSTLASAPHSFYTRAARTYAALSIKLVDALWAGAQIRAAALPAGLFLNVNYPAAAACAAVDDYKFVLTRLLDAQDGAADDVHTCGKARLPTETAVVAAEGCYVSVSVADAYTKGDVDAAAQQAVLEQLGQLLTCLPQ